MSDLVNQIVGGSHEIEGLSISGGEPLQQAAALKALLDEVREQTHKSVLLFSGYTRQEIERMPTGASILGLVDVLICGRYVGRLQDGRALRGSSNQEVCFLTPRYGPDDLSRIPAIEVKIDANGMVEATGIRALDVAPARD